MQAGTLLKGIGGFYYILGEDGREYTVRAKKKLRKLHVTPMAGDRVEFIPGVSRDEHGWLENILPRQNEFIRPPIANVTLLCIVIAPEPEPDWLLVDKLLVLAAMRGIRTMLLVNKADLSMTEEILQNLKAYEKVCGSVLMHTNLDMHGQDELKKRIARERVCFAGQSGVGKTSTINSLLQLGLETGGLSEKIQRGKNTTRRAELFVFDDVQIFDTPGFSLLELDREMPPESLQLFYPEMQAFREGCRFIGCLHLNEPGCGVKQAVREGSISALRYERYAVLCKKRLEEMKNRYD